VFLTNGTLQKGIILPPQVPQKRDLTAKAKLVKVVAPFIMRFAAKTKT